MRAAFLFSMAVLLIAACAGSTGDPAPGARADFINASGDPIGTATLWGQSDGVRIRVNVREIPEGAHGFHIHAVGQCAPAEFQSAGGHFNPHSRKHGTQNPEGPHAGDLPNLTAAAGGVLQAEAVAPGVTLESLFDSDGSALVIHASPDDYTTDPAGNAGARIACAVIRRP